MKYKYRHNGVVYTEETALVMRNAWLVWSVGCVVGGGVCGWNLSEYPVSGGVGLLICAVLASICGGEAGTYRGIADAIRKANEKES